MADKIRAYILVETKNGKIHKYVRNKVFIDGDSVLNSAYYSYGDTVGDSLGAQIGDSGYILQDYIDLVALYTGGDSIQMWPEDVGDTYVLKRPNRNQLNGSDYGDSDIAPYTHLILATDAIQSFIIIEERIPITSAS
jgi:hypothetical protein